MIFDITSPLLGFENIKQVKLEKIDDIFMKMSSTENELLSFTLIDPFVLKDYDFKLPVEISKELKATKESNLLILNVLLIQTPIEESLVNFTAPLIFNSDTNLMTQIIVENSNNDKITEKISDFLNK